VNDDTPIELAPAIDPLQGIELCAALIGLLDLLDLGELPAAVELVQLLRELCELAECAALIHPK
jgi:hypothetical protein